jgi:hypothetical protein
MRGVPGNSRNIGAADTNVGKLAVAQARQFVQALIIALPLLDEADECGKHNVLLSLRKVRPVPVSSLAPKIGMFRAMKSNKVALQLSQKRIAKTGILKGKIQFCLDLKLS